MSKETYEKYIICQKSPIIHTLYVKRDLSYIKYMSKETEHIYIHRIYICRPTKYVKGALMSVNIYSIYRTRHTEHLTRASLQCLRDICQKRPTTY